MQNLLVNKIKNAKRELTALKTAHNRGLGLVKVYRSILRYVDTSIPNNYYGDAVVTVDFDNSFGAYPFTYIEGRIDGVRSTVYKGWYSADMQQVRYSNNGYRAVFYGKIWYSSGTYFNRLYVYSTSPIISISIAQA